MHDNIIMELVVVFAGAAIFSTLFLYLKQPIILAYIALGIAIGPWGFGYISDAAHMQQLSHIGIILLLFLIGLNLQPSRLWALLGKVSLLTIVTSFTFLLAGMAVPLLFGYPFVDSLIIGAALMFSSTIIGLKLIPTWTLHHNRTGEMMTSVLLMQDILAILLILLMVGGEGGMNAGTIVILLGKLVALAIASFLMVKYVVTRLFITFDTFSEYAFLLSLGWGLMVAGIAQTIGLSFEIGAFIAGVTFATMPVALPIADLLRPLRDFFLILFFVSIGAQFNYLIAEDLLFAGICLTLILVVFKPIIFSWGFRSIGVANNTSRELGARLGQGSEFSLLIGYAALEAGLIAPRSSYLIQLAVILSFVFSTYWVVLNYATPISRGKSHSD